MSGAIATAVIVGIQAGVMSTAFALALGAAVANIAIGAVISMAMSLVMQALAPTPKRPDQQVQNQPDRQANIKQPIMMWQYIYGQARVGGAITFEHSTNSNQTLHYLLTIAGHPVSEIGSLYFNDILIPLTDNGDGSWSAAAPTDPDPAVVAFDWSNNLTVWKGLGTTVGDAALLVALMTNCPDKWTSAHRQAGRAKVYLEFTYSSSLFKGGFPRVTVVVKGKPVFDPRNLGAAITSSAIGAPGVFTTGTAHNLIVGQQVYIGNHTATGGRDGGVIDGNYTVDTVPTGSTFTLIDCDFPVAVTAGGAGGNVTALIWSPNPALCTRDYMADRPIGPHILSTEIDDTGALTASANVCEAYVTLPLNSQTFTTTLSDTPAAGVGASVSPIFTHIYGINGFVSITVNSGGSGYVNPIAVSSPDVGAKFNVVTSGGVITAVNVLYGGSFNGIFGIDDMLEIDDGVSSGPPSLSIIDTGISNDSIVVPIAIAWPTGTQVFVTTTDTQPSGLTDGVPYYVINPTAGGISSSTTYQLSDTVADALLGQVVPLGSAGSGTLTISRGCAFTSTVAGSLLTTAFTSVTTPLDPSITTTQYTTSSFPYRTGDRVQLVTTGALPTGLSADTTYYWIANDTQNGMVAASLTEAFTRTPVTFSDTGIGTHIVFVTHEQTYTCNGVLDTTELPSALIPNLLSSMSGKVAWTAGQFVLLAGSYRTPAVTITRSDLIGPIQLQTTMARRDLFNRVKGTFIDPVNGWQPNDFPPVSNSAYVAADQGSVLWSNIDLPLTDSSSTAQRLAKIGLESARRQMSILLQCKLTMIQTQVGDVVMITDVRFGWTAKTFEIIDWTFAAVPDANQVPFLGINLLLRETDAAVYAWTTAEETISSRSPRTSLPTPFKVAPPTSLTASESLYTTGSGTALVSNLTVSWTAAADGFAQWYVVEYAPAGSGAWTQGGSTQVPNTHVVINNLAVGSYDIRVKTLNAFGAPSVWSTTLAGAVVRGIANLPSLTGPEVIGISEQLVIINNGQGVNSQATVSFSEPVNTAWTAIGVVVTSYQVEWSPAGAGEWQPVGQCSISPFLVLGAIGQYDWRVKAVTSLGIETPYSLTFAFELMGLTAPPADITGFAASAVNGLCYVQWDTPADLDVRIGGHVRVKYTPKTSGTTWNDGTDIGPNFPGTATHGLLPLLTGTYMVEAVDSTGNYSVNFSEMAVIAPVITQFSGIITITEDPVFAGLKTNCMATEGILELTGVTLIDSMGLMDDQSLIDYMGGVSTSGEYDFSAAYSDLGGVYTVRLTSAMTAIAVDTGDLIDNRTGNIDKWPTMDGNIVNSTNAVLYVSTTQTDPAISPAWSAWSPFYVGDYSARAFKFKVMLKSGLTTNNIQISALSVSVSLHPATVNIGSGLVVAAIGSSYTYAVPFYTTPVINITPHNLSTGDYWLISSNSRTGFTIEFFDSSGSGVARIADISVSGFGQQTA